MLGDRSSAAIRRRDALARIGAIAALAARIPSAHAAPAPPACVVRPAQTEGPFFVDQALERSDIRDGAEGAPLRLAFNVSRISGATCAALAGARVDVWHCDAAGRYSGVAGRTSTAGQRFLRGSQLSDADGAARFVTVYPGWYRGRAVHIHFKIRATDGGGQHREFTSQLYFDDALSRRVFAAAPYASRGQQWMRNADDFIYRDGGAQLMLAPRADDARYDAAFAIALAMR
jgi:protocatechuate 3,4-dioxygenase beta subunit